MRKSTNPILVVAAVIEKAHQADDRILIVRRGPFQSGSGFWEFPGGKVEDGETAEQALIREIQEELGVAITVKDFVGELDFSYPTKTIRLRVYKAVTDLVGFRLTEHDDFKWMKPAEIDIQELSEADRPFIEMLKKREDYPF